MEKIMNKMKIIKDRKKRSSMDNHQFDFLLRKEIEKGELCPKKSISWMYSNYGTRLDH